MKKTVLFLLVIALAACNLPVLSMAVGDNSVSYTLNGIYSQNDTTLDCDIELSGNEDVGLWSVNLLLKFNLSALSIDAGSISVGDVFTADNSEVEACIYDGMVSDSVGYLYINFNPSELENIHANGRLVSLSFDIIDKSLDYGFELIAWGNDEYNHSKINQTNDDLLPVSFSFEALIESGIKYTVGDINGDDSVNLRDVFILSTFVKFAAVPSEVERLCADVNGDGSINVLDSFEMNYRVANGSWRK